MSKLSCFQAFEDYVAPTISFKILLNMMLGKWQSISRKDINKSNVGVQALKEAILQQLNIQALDIS